jgi:3-dehydroquinate dehydratase-2
MAPKKILLLNGPNLNLLGTREPHIYGYETLTDIEQKAISQAEKGGHTMLCYQTNHEGNLIDRIHQAREEKVDAIIVSHLLRGIFRPYIYSLSQINAAAYTHTSVALRDAITGINVPFVEVHISNVHKREEFRHKSFLSDKAVAVICGLGTYGYTAALEFVTEHLAEKAK